MTQQYFEQLSSRKYNISLKHIWSEAWQKNAGAKSKIWIAFLIYYVIYLAANTALSLFGFDINNLQSAIAFLAAVALAVFTMPIWIGVTMLGVKRAVDKPLSIKGIFSYFSYTMQLFLFMLLVTVAVFFPSTLIFLVFGLLGLENNLIPVLLVIAVIFYVAVCCTWGGYLVVQKSLSGWRAFKLGFKLVTQHWFKCAASLSLQSLPLLLSLIIIGLGVTIVYDQASSSSYYAVVGLLMMIGGIVGMAYFLPLLFVSLGILYREIFGYKNPAMPKIVMTTDAIDV